MKITLPLASIKDAIIRQCLSTIETALSKLKEYAVVPPGGAAGSVLVKVDARNYNTTFESRSDTAADIASAAAAVNTSGKYIGRSVFDTTNNRLMVASGSTPTSVWWRADGGLSVTPS